jgi:hypothetical protein
MGDRKMAEDFTSKFRNPELEAVINRAQTSGELRELMLQELSRQGHIVRVREDEFDIRRGPGAAEAQSAPSLPVSGYKFERTIRFHESTGKRALVIRADTKEQLDALEHQIVGY